MTRDDIIAMAREAGFTAGDFASFTDLIVHFGMLVAAAEREACAKVCDDTFYSVQAADAIRARGNNA
jgi:hypothetical protein